MQIAMSTIIVSPDSCVVHAFICVLCWKESSAAEIHRKLCLEFRLTVMREGKVRQWFRTFKNDTVNVHDVEWRSRSSIHTDETIEEVNRKLRNDR